MLEYLLKMSALQNTACFESRWLSQQLRCPRRLQGARFQSTFAPAFPRDGHGRFQSPQRASGTVQPSPLQRLSNWHLLRNTILSFFLTRPIVLKPGLAFMKKVANSKSAILHPDRNPVLRALIKPIVYDHFCAGRNASEVKQTVADIKRLGFKGVILSFNKEIQLDKDNEFLGAQSSKTAEIEAWRDANLESLDMIENGDWLGMKFTGAGQDVTEALIKREKPPPAFDAAMRAICEKAKAKGCRIWADAEQQAVQAGIDQWTIEFMRQYNIQGEPLLYHTVQAYLKESRNKLKYQLELARKEGWSLGVKLVRGAYIENDTRSLIHDTKADTDANYNGIVRDVLRGDYDGITKSDFPRIRLFLASHNSETVVNTLDLARRLASKGELHISPEFGQLQGMADDVGGKIIQFGEELQRERESSQELAVASSPPASEKQRTFVPQAYKALHWGSLQVSMQYLVRRAIENSAAVDRMRETAVESRRELFRRFKRRFSPAA